MPTPRQLAPVIAFLVAAPTLGAAHASPRVFTPAGMTADRFPVATDPLDVDIPAHDGVPLRARIYKPDTSADDAWRTPVILFHTPYDGSMNRVNPVNPSSRSKRSIIDFFTPKGYTVVLSHVRGSGTSGGCFDMDGRDQALDLETLVEYFASRPWSNGRVGGVGVSYDGEALNAGAILAPEGLATIVTIEAISGVYDTANFDGVPLLATGPTSAAFFASISHDPPEPAHAAREVDRQACQPRHILGSSDASGDMTPYFREREFRFGVANVRASLLYVQSFRDVAVRPINIVGWYDEFPGFKRAMFGQWRHGAVEEAEDEFARDDWFAMLHAWLDYFLLDLQTGVESWPAVQVQDEDNVWRIAPSFGELGVTRSMPLGIDGLGSGGPADAERAFSEQLPTTWDGPVLPEGIHLSGLAILDATITIDAPDAHFMVKLQEVLPNGNVRMLTRGYLSAPHRGSLTTPAPVPIGRPVAYRIRTYPMDRTVRPGSRLRLVLGGREDASVFVPLVFGDEPGVPAGNGFNATIRVDGASVLHLPVVEDPCGLIVAQRSQPRAEIPSC